MSGRPTTRSPSVATTVMATVLGILSSLFLGGMTLVYGVVATDAAGPQLGIVPWLTVYLIVQAIGSAISSILMFVGSVLLIVRKPLGPWGIGIGFVIAALVAISPVALSAVLDDASAEIVTRNSLTVADSLSLIFVLVSVGTPLLAAVFTFLPSTRRYCTR